jgi:hypothetical protein
MKKLVSQFGYGPGWVGGGLVIAACLAYGFSLGLFAGMLQIAVMAYIWNRERINKLFREYSPARPSVKTTRLDEIIHKAGTGVR